MNNPLETILQQTGRHLAAFAPSSRYYGMETATLESAGGQTILYVRRRFVPSSEQMTPVTEHKVKEGERIDYLANQYLGDPGLFWQICDANGVLHPDDLMEHAGERIVITLSS